jgi:hypothetical protein
LFLLFIYLFIYLFPHKVFLVPDEAGKAQYVWVGNQWVTSTLPGRPRNNDLLYWSVLEFDGKGNILQFVRSENTTFSIASDDGY